MVRTNNGFDISEADLKLRGPGNLQGTEQSGMLQFRIADLAKDGRILQTARELAMRVLEDDPSLERPHHHPIRWYYDKYSKKRKGWSYIS